MVDLVQQDGDSFIIPDQVMCQSSVHALFAKRGMERRAKGLGWEAFRAWHDPQIAGIRVVQSNLLEPDEIALVSRRDDRGRQP
jgi:hypothetical protein